MLAADTSARSARSSLRSPGRLSHVYRLAAHVPVFRRVRRLRLVVGTGGAVSILPARKIRLSGRLHRRSATVSEAQDRSVFAVGSFVCQPAPVGHLDASLPKEKGTNCLLAAQLCGSTRPGAVAWPGGRAASCLLVGVCQGAGHVMAPGRVSRYAVRPTSDPRCRTFPPPTRSSRFVA